MMPSSFRGVMKARCYCDSTLLLQCRANLRKPPRWLYAGSNSKPWRPSVTKDVAKQHKLTDTMNLKAPIRYSISQDLTLSTLWAATIHVYLKYFMIICSLHAALLWMHSILWKKARQNVSSDWEREFRESKAFFSAKLLRMCKARDIFASVLKEKRRMGRQNCFSRTFMRQC